MKTARKHSWVEDLHGSLGEWAATPFEWGEHDCALAVCNHIHAMTGVDVAAEIRGKYSSEAGAEAMLHSLGGASLEAVVEQLAAKHGFLEVNVKMAHRGDVLLYDTPQGQALAIVGLNGRHAHIATPKGAHRLRSLNARRAWHIPFHS